MSTPPLHEAGTFIPLAPPGDSNNFTWTESDKSGLGAFGISVLKALLRYRVLNKQNIERALNISDQTPWKKDNLAKVLRGMRASGHIDAYIINQSSLVAYILTTEGEEYLTQKGLIIPEMSTGKDIIKDTATALKCISVNQWHIGTLQRLPIKESFYNQFMIDQKKIPSLIRFKQDKGIISLFAYPAPRQGDSINSFAEDILKAHHFVLEHPKYYPASYILICESRTSASTLAHQMTYIRQMRPIADLLYTFDEATGKEDFLKSLYLYDVSEDDFTKQAVDLT